MQLFIVPLQEMDSQWCRSVDVIRGAICRFMAAINSTVMQTVEFITPYVYGWQNRPPVISQDNGPRPRLGIYVIPHNKNIYIYPLPDKHKLDWPWSFGYTDIISHYKIYPDIIPTTVRNTTGHHSIKWKAGQNHTQLSYIVISELHINTTICCISRPNVV